MRILSIDGGGVFGCIPAYFLSQRTDWLNKFDVFAGTSVGAHIACCLAAGIQSDVILDLFTKKVKGIFDRRRRWWWKGPKFDDATLNEELHTILGDRTFGSLRQETGKYLVVNAYDMKNRKPKVFDNMAGSDDMDVPLWEAARASSAAPTFFAPWKDCVDGGVVANCPVMVAVMAVRSKLNQTLGSIEIFSLGTGVSVPPKWADSIAAKWGPVGWLPTVLDLVTTGNETRDLFMVRWLPLRNFVRFDPVLHEDGWKFDNPKIVDDCLAKAEGYVKPFRAVMDSFLDRSPSVS